MTAMNRLQNMRSYSLQSYVDKMKRGERFSLARYGDGEFYCMWGKKGQNSNGCKYTEELRQALYDSMNHQYDPTFIYGMQRILPHDRARAEKEYPETDWHDTEIFSEAVAEGKLYPLIEQLRKMPLVVICNHDVSDAIRKIIPGREINKIIPIRRSNAYEDRKLVVNECLKYKDEERVYLFSCGMAANAFISELHGKVDGWLIDVGHIWDPFVGNMSRCDLEGKTMEDINLNLKPWSAV